MFKFTVIIFAMIACAAAKPGLFAAAPLAYTATAAVVAAPAPARNYNGITAAPIVSAAPVVRTIAPVATTFAAPVVAPVAVPFVAARYASPLAYTTPLAYHAAGAPILF